VAIDPCPELSLGMIDTVVFLKGIIEDVGTMGCDALVFEAIEPFCFPLTLFKLLGLVARATPQAPSLQRVFQ
jgi:hypothetical protein